VIEENKFNEKGLVVTDIGLSVPVYKWGQAVKIWFLI
jgi:hypothetical protein